ncbi:MAG: hypothetical protein AAF590_02715 [Pseudomonadota bacterium]
MIRWICALRFAVCAVAVVFATQTHAAELPISDVFGDERGCARISDSGDFTERGGITVSPTEFTGLEWGCSWAEVWAYPQSDGRAFAVQGLCGGEGTPFLEQFVFELAFDDRTQMTVFSANGDPRWDLEMCKSPTGGKN